MNPPTSTSPTQAGLIARTRRWFIERMRWRVGYYHDMMLPPFPTDGLEDRTIVVRPYTAADAEGYREILHTESADAARLPSITGSVNAWHEEVSENFRLQRGPYHLAVIAGSEGEYAGTIILEPMRDPGRSVEMTVALHPRAQRLTVGPRAARLVLSWLIEGGVHRVEIRHALDNTAACRASTGIGLAQEGVARAATPVPTDDGIEWVDACVHAAVNPADRRVGVRADQ